MASTESPFPKHQDPEYWRRRQEALDEALGDYRRSMPDAVAEAFFDVLVTRPPAPNLPPRAQESM